MDKKPKLDHTTTSSSEEKKDENVQKTYSKPQLDELGDLRTITLGNSPFDTPDSDMTGLFNNT